MGTKQKEDDLMMQRGMPLVNKGSKQPQSTIGKNKTLTPNGIKRARELLDSDKDLPLNEILGEERDELQIVPLQNNEGVWKMLRSKKGK